jgi:SOS-response transcriptional repressor LexA
MTTLSSTADRPQVTEALGPRIRRQRRRLGLTLDELAGRSSISKPYLSLIETGRVVNPPSDEKLRRLEQTLGFTPGELLTQAHLQRTPKDVRAVLHRLMGQGGEVAVKGKTGANEIPLVPASLSPSVPSSPAPSAPAQPDDVAYLSSVLQELSDRPGGKFEHMSSNAVPVINRVATGYPRDFADLGYPPKVADEYLSCPDVTDRQAFAARVHGDSMTPKYRPGDIVIFSPALSARDGDDCFVRFADGQTTFNRIFFESGEDNHPVLRLQPRNERYRAQTVASEKVAGLYKAVYRYQRVDEE